MTKEKVSAVFIVAIAAGTMLYAQGVTINLPGMNRGYSPKQPIEFSHRVHSGDLGMSCQYCHTGVDKSRHAGIPSASTCMNCHRFVNDFVRAGDELISPFDGLNPPDLRRGMKVYQTYCQVCHGIRGQGDGLVTQHGFPAPPSLLFGKALNMKDGHIFYIISVGFRNMPSYASQIEIEDRWLAVAYVRDLQGKQRAP